MSALVVIGKRRQKNRSRLVITAGAWAAEQEKHWRRRHGVTIAATANVRGSHCSCVTESLAGLETLRQPLKCLCLLRNRLQRHWRCLGSAGWHGDRHRDRDDLE